MVVLSSDQALEKLQHCELDLLLAFAAFCDEHSLTWFLDSGSALGAVRHRGFIPWDDDVDVGMPREDYDALLRLSEEFPDGYSLHTLHNTSGYTSLFAKLYKDGTSFENELTREAGTQQGIFLDIFPYDFLANDSNRAAFQKRNARIWQAMLYMYRLKHVSPWHSGCLGSLEKGFSRVGHTVLHPFLSPEQIERKFNRSIPESGESVSSLLIATPWPQYGPFPSDVLFPTAMRTFEGHEFPVPRKVDNYLEIMYGDWRTLPKPEDRHTHMPVFIDFGDGSCWSRG